MIGFFRQVNIHLIIIRFLLKNSFRVFFFRVEHSVHDQHLKSFIFVEEKKTSFFLSKAAKNSVVEFKLGLMPVDDFFLSIDAKLVFENCE